jgi:serine O-acetyltransferase
MKGCVYVNPTERTYWSVDRALYGKHALVLQPAYWAVAVYRFGRWTRSAPVMIKPLAHFAYFFAYSIVRLATGIDIPRGAQFGPGLLIHHFGGIIIHPQSVVGARCVMRHGVTIGAKDSSGPPKIGDDVVIGAYAQLLGSITVGDGARIGAMAVVLRDVPDGATVVGNPGRIITRKSAD